MDRHAAYLIMARRLNLHKQAGYIDADFFFVYTLSLALRRRTIHLRNLDPNLRQTLLPENDFGKSASAYRKPETALAATTLHTRVSIKFGNRGGDRGCSALYAFHSGQ
jgi:hypothetical protein